MRGRYPVANAILYIMHIMRLCDMPPDDRHLYRAAARDVLSPCPLRRKARLSGVELTASLTRVKEGAL